MFLLDIDLNLNVDICIWGLELIVVLYRFDIKEIVIYFLCDRVRWDDIDYMGVRCDI